MLKGVTADLYWTGEMAHVRRWPPIASLSHVLKHEVLATVAGGTHVLLCAHVPFTSSAHTLTSSKVVIPIPSAGT